jgi:hypothetical protein
VVEDFSLSSSYRVQLIAVTVTLLAVESIDRASLKMGMIGEFVDVTKIFFEQMFIMTWKHLHQVCNRCALIMHSLLFL